MNNILLFYCIMFKIINNFYEYHSDILLKIEKYLNMRSFKLYIILLNVTASQ